jgi:DNA-binding winged helix-turn-helix (wHTH) protein/tetratricopeptide (TPR) repeat protein
LDVDSAARRICVGQTQVSIEPKVFDLLMFLVGKQGCVISQDELLEQVWGRTVASDAVVSQAVYKLRVLLKNHGQLGDALVTLRGVGYRLDAPVEWQTPLTTGRTDPWFTDWRKLAPAAFLLTGLLVWWQAWQTVDQIPPRVALLSLDNATGNADLDWVSAGAAAMMSEELLRRGVDVVSQSDLEKIAAQRGTDADDLGAAAHLAGVEQVIVPRLLPHEDGFRLELVDLASQRVIPLELTGGGPATLSLAMAGQLADYLRAPLRPPAGQLGLGNPFLDEAYARAYYHRQKGQFSDARELYEYILREAPNAHWARYHLSITLRRAGEMEAARDHLAGLLETELDDAWLAAAVRSTLGNLAWYEGDLERASDLYLQARERFATHDMIGGVASALGNLGMVAFSRADFQRGREFAVQALEIYQRQANQVQTARLLHNIGYSYYDEGAFEPALEYLQRAHQMRHELGLKDQATNTRTVIAEIAVEQGRLDEGTRLLEQALAEFTESGNPRGRSRTLANLARVANRRGDFRQAREWALESLTMAQSRNEVASIGQTALILGRSLHAAGDLYGAEDYYRQAADVWMKLDNPPGRITCLAEKIRLALDRDHPDQAGELLEELEPLALEFADERYIDTLRVLRVRLKIASGDLPGIEPDLAAVLADFDHQRFDHAELIIELAEALHAARADHPLLAGLKPAAEHWATRYFPAARHLYQAASDPDDCQAASRALEQLQSPDWRQSLTPAPACETG